MSKVKKLLVVEGRSESRWYPKGILEMTGYEPTLCRDGEEGLEQGLKKINDLSSFGYYDAKGRWIHFSQREQEGSRESPNLFLTGKKSTRTTSLKGSKSVQMITSPQPFSMEELLLRISMHPEKNQRNLDEVTALKCTISEISCCTRWASARRPKWEAKLTSKRMSWSGF